MAERAPDPIHRALARLARGATETPWALSTEDRDQARAAGLDDAAILHALALAAYFGHLNRIADAVGIDLDYQVAHTPPHAEPATMPYRRPDPEAWPDPDRGDPLDLGLRPGLDEALEHWRSHVLERDAPLGRPRRIRIARAVAERLGDAAALRTLTDPGGGDPLDEALVAMADEVTLAPWRLGAATVEALRAAGLADDETVFDALATASSCTVFSRLTVTRHAIGSPPR